MARASISNREVGAAREAFTLVEVIANGSGARVVVSRLSAGRRVSRRGNPFTVIFDLPVGECAGLKPATMPGYRFSGLTAVPMRLVTATLIPSGEETPE